MLEYYIIFRVCRAPSFEVIGAVQGTEPWEKMDNQLLSILGSLALSHGHPLQYDFKLHSSPH
jgi:hypothetical protein